MKSGFLSYDNSPEYSRQNIRVVNNHVCTFLWRQIHWFYLYYMFGKIISIKEHFKVPIEEMRFSICIIWGLNNSILYHFYYFFSSNTRKCGKRRENIFWLWDREDVRFMSQHRLYEFHFFVSLKSVLGPLTWTWRRYLIMIIITTKVFIIHEITVTNQRVYVISRCERKNGI